MRRRARARRTGEGTLRDSFSFWDQLIEFPLRRIKNPSDTSERSERPKGAGGRMGMVVGQERTRNVKDSRVRKDERTRVTRNHLFFLANNRKAKKNNGTNIRNTQICTHEDRYHRMWDPCCMKWTLRSGLCNFKQERKTTIAAEGAPPLES